MTKKKKPLKKKTMKIQKKNKKRKISGVSITVGIIVFFGATAPFLNNFPWDRSYRVFGFRHMGTFLAAFGQTFAIFSCAIFVLWISNFIDPQHRKVVKIVHIVGGTFLAIGIYFLLWIFSPTQDFPKYVYEIAFSIAAIIIAYVTYLLNNFTMNTVLKNKYNVNNLTQFIFKMRSKYFFPMAFNAINKENREKIEEDIDKLDEEIFETLDEISK